MHSRPQLENSRLRTTDTQKLSIVRQLSQAKVLRDELHATPYRSNFDRYPVGYSVLGVA